MTLRLSSIRPAFVVLSILMAACSSSPTPVGPIGAEGGAGVGGSRDAQTGDSGAAGADGGGGAEGGTTDGAPLPPADALGIDAQICDPSLSAPAVLITAECNSTVAREGAGGTIPDGTYQLISIEQGGPGCLPDSMPPPASGLLRVAGTSVAGVDGSMGPAAVVFSSWTGNLVYTATTTQIGYTCGISRRYGNETRVDLANGTVTFYRRRPPIIEAWTYKRQ
jgi:hypothetical protein